MLGVAASYASLTGQRWAIATIVAAQSSVPRPVGTSMLVGADGSVIGSLSGGCVESAVYEACRDTLADGRPRREVYGWSTATAWQVGLMCGGRIEVLIEVVPRLDADQAALLDADTPAALIRRTDGRTDWRVVSLPLDRAASSDPATFVQMRRPAPRALVFGSNDIAAAVVAQFALLDYRISVVDARARFTDPARYPAAQVVVDQPGRWFAAEVAARAVDERTVILCLHHEARFETPVLTQALALPVAYVGAMGSRRAHAERVERLRAAGLDDRALAALHSPIGLDLGAVSPAEIAVAVAAEVVAAVRGHGAAPLRETTGALHDATRQEIPAWT